MLTVKGSKNIFKRGKNVTVQKILMVHISEVYFSNQFQISDFMTIIEQCTFSLPQRLLPEFEMLDMSVGV